ncbi:MAG: helix-turn-helix domain-containing protein, partial [Myxococcales bacterium]|nr:helix-turn-helix domain-containing protein [Myxococcales bacterium]
ARGSVELGAGMFTLWDSTAPLRFDVPEPLRKLTLLVPAEVFTAAVEQPQRYLGRAFDASTGCGALMLAQLGALDRLSSPLTPPQQDAALRSTLDLLGAAVGDTTDGAATLVDEIVRHARARLTDPELDPDAIADTLGVSRRQLDRAFATTGCTITRWIWRERAERCRCDMILEPRASLLELAVRWGFSEASHFTRVFRREFGCTPRAYRRSVRAR